ncbi:MAG: class II aldolase/adducin family protein [Bryobacteraceae bacterium]|nr:class II aldolase/adducin family protein [Bryobacteraceae bacterium]
MRTELTELCGVAASFHRRGYAFGSTGNLSVRLNDEVWITPTGRSLRDLKPDDLACITLDGQRKNEARPSKEFPFHLGCYRAALEARALVHLHATHSVAISCLTDLDPAEPLPVITPYYLMRVAPLGIVDYFTPGSAELGAAVEKAAASHSCMLLRNHGLIALGATLSEAVDRAEELEETARLYFLLRGERTRALTAEQREAIAAAYPRR